MTDLDSILPQYDLDVFKLTALREDMTAREYVTKCIPNKAGNGKWFCIVSTPWGFEYKECVDLAESLNWTLPELDEMKE